MIKAGIAGATGYTGAELVRILSAHPDVMLTALTSRQFSNVRFSHVYPAMEGAVDLVCEDLSIERLTMACDVVFTALPHKIPMTIIPDLIAAGKKVVDLSADFRFNDVSRYEAAYQPHMAKDLLKNSVYGLSEVYDEAIGQASLIGNPGCYPTSALLPLIPLVKRQLLDMDTIIIDAKSGVSGAGRSLSITSHFCEVNESLKAYKVAEHRHNPEIEAILSQEAAKSVSVTFVPHLIPMTRGMLTTVYANVLGGVDFNDVQDCLRSYYRHRPFVRVCDMARVPDTLHVRGTNYCDIGFRLDRNRNRLVLISVIDNLVKGAAGQAVQNMNIMFGLDETEGLVTTPFPI